MLNFLRFI